MKIGRAGKRINYAEAASGDEDMDVDIEGKEGHSDDSDFMGGGGGSGIRNTLRREGSRLGSHATPQPQPVKSNPFQSYLGGVPPSRIITSVGVHPTKHVYS